MMLMAEAVEKSRRGVPAYTLYVNRPLGRWLAKGAYGLGLSANQVTTASGLLTTGGIATIVLSRPSVGAGLAVAVLLAIGFVLDSADGQLARLRGGGAAAGEWYDHVLDCARLLALHGSVLVSTYRFTPDAPAWHLALPMAFQLVAVVQFFAMVLAEQLQRRRGDDQPAVGDGSVLRSVLLLPVDFGVVCLTFVLLGWPRLFWVAYPTLFTTAGSFLLLSLRQSYRRLAA